MELFEVLKTRRSIRKFLPKPVEREKIERLLEAAFLAPSSHNHRPWHFVVVTKRQVLDRLSLAKDGAQGLRNAPAAIVVCVDQTKSDVWVEDGSIAAHNINLAAVDLGLGSFWVQIRNRQHNAELSAEEYVQNLLGLRPELRVVCIIGFGYKLRSKPPHEPRIEWDKVSWI